MWLLTETRSWLVRLADGVREPTPGLDIGSLLDVFCTEIVSLDPACTRCAFVAPVVASAASSGCCDVFPPRPLSTPTTLGGPACVLVPVTFAVSGSTEKMVIGSALSL